MVINLVNDCTWCTQNGHQDGSSFIWHQPCNNQTALLVHHFGEYSETRNKKLYSHSLRIAYDKSALSLLGSREWRYIHVKAINSNESTTPTGLHECMHAQKDV